jgi:hypothetical protein
MKPLDLLDQLDKGAGTFGFIATYEFDPQFFERRILSKRTFGHADRIAVFMDRGRYQELINGGLAVSGFNRRYLVIPIGRAPDVFHPKLYLALGEKRADGLVGSSNCTNAGIAYNMELCSAFAVRADNPDSDDGALRFVLRQVYEAMKSFAADAGVLKETLESQFFKPVEDRFPWLHRGTAIPAAEIELLHSHCSALWAQVTRRLEKETVRIITIIAANALAWSLLPGFGFATNSRIILVRPISLDNLVPSSVA